MAVLDVFTYVFKSEDKGVEAKLDAIAKKGEKVTEANEALTDSFKELATEASSSLGQIVPGAEKVISTLNRLGSAFNKARAAGAKITVAPGQAPSTRLAPGGQPPPPRVPSVPTGAGGGEAAGTAALGGASASIAAGVAAVALVGLAVAAGVVTKAFTEGAATLSESRSKAREAGVNATQMAAAEQYAKSFKLDKSVAQNTLLEIAKTTQAGWVKAREFGNIWGIGNEQTQLLKHRGISTSSRGGELRNSAAIFDDITKKMVKMPKDQAVAFGQFFGMTKDFATSIADGKKSFSEFAMANKEVIATQAKAIELSRAYDRAQQGLTNAWDDFRIKVGGKLLPVITQLITKLAEAAPIIEQASDAAYGFFLGLRDIAQSTFDWLKTSTSSLANDVFGQTIGGQLSGFVGAYFKNQKNMVSDVASNTVGYWADYAKKDREESAIADVMKKEGVNREQAMKIIEQRRIKDQKDYVKDLNQQTSDNAKAANVQLEAANLMKTVTAKFGLSMEQFMAMWAATTGKMSGLRGSGGVTTADFRDIYKDVVSQYATPEVSYGLYGRGAPMMAQMPAQYAMGFGVTPQGIPRNAKGLDQAKKAVDVSNTPVGNGKVPFGKGRGGGGETNIDVTTGPITINTKSTDPQEISRVVGNSLADQTKYALSKLNDGQIV